MDMRPQLRLHGYASPATAAWIVIPSYGCMDMRPPATATTTSPKQRVQKQSFSDAQGAEGGGTRLTPDVVRGGTDVYLVCDIVVQEMSYAEAHAVT